jgi:hypothetical protein
MLPNSRKAKRKKPPGSPSRRRRGSRKEKGSSGRCHGNWEQPFLMGTGRREIDFGIFFLKKIS